MSDYVLSPEAISDLQNIYDFTVGEWGEAQAEKYLNEIYAVFERLTQYPSIGRLRPELADGLRSIPIGAHVIFFMPWPSRHGSGACRETGPSRYRRGNPC